MQCIEGRPGRVFVLRIDHGEDLIRALETCITEKDIRCGFIQVLGAVRSAHLVTGPEEPILPPVPHREEIHDGWEIVGIGTVSWSNGNPRVHLHTATGRGLRAMTGCMRDAADVYIVVEAVIFEVRGMETRRFSDPLTGLSLPDHVSRD
ncbi:MAG: DNA-binding protein [Methanolinea sp.]|nr:DNA-binding protein [Methanolinea sp.]